jgi:hypothetical protein
MATSLEDALKGEVSKTAEPTTEAETEGGGAPPEDKAAAPETESKPERGETPEAQAEPEDPDRPRDPKTGRFTDVMPYTSYKSEKSKRQELEKAKTEWEKERATLAREAQEAKALRERIAALEAQSRQPPQHQQQPQHPAQPQQQRLHPVLERQLAEMRFDLRLEVSQERALDKYGKEALDAAGAAFQQAAAQNPALFAQFREAKDPVGEVVRWHQKQQTLDKLGDNPEAYIEAEVAKRLEAMRQAPATPQNAKPKPNLPTDLSGAPNVGSRNGRQWSGPTDLSDILPS